MAFLRRFVWIFVSPTKVFDEIRDSRVGWWQPWIIVSLLTIVATLLMAPMQRALIEMDPDVAAGVTEKQMAMMQTMQMVMAPALVLLFATIAAGISYVAVTLQSREATFKKYFTLLMFANIVFSLGYLFGTALMRARGVDSVASPEDLHLSLSLRMLAPEANPVVRGILGSVEFFSLWGLALVVVGLRRIFGLRLGQAIGCVIPLWILYMVMSIVGEKFAPMG